MFSRSLKGNTILRMAAILSFACAPAVILVPGCSGGGDNQGSSRVVSRLRGVVSLNNNQLGTVALNLLQNKRVHGTFTISNGAVASQIKAAQGGFRTGTYQVSGTYNDSNVLTVTGKIPGSGLFSIVVTTEGEGASFTVTINNQTFGPAPIGEDDGTIPTTTPTVTGTPTTTATVTGTPTTTPTVTGTPTTTPTVTGTPSTTPTVTGTPTTTPTVGTTPTTTPTVGTTPTTTPTVGTTPTTTPTVGTTPTTTPTVGATPTTTPTVGATPTTTPTVGATPTTTPTVDPTPTTAPIQPDRKKSKR